MKKWLGILVAVAVLVAGTVVVLDRRAEAQRKRDRHDAQAVGMSFLQAWQAKRFADMGRLTAEDPDAGTSFANLERRLQVTKTTITPGSLAGDGTHLPFHVALVLAGLGPVEWDNTLVLVKRRPGWRVGFTSSTVYPGLRNGQGLRRSQPLTSRGQLVDRHGTPIRAADADLAANVLGSDGASKTGLERIYDAQLTGSSGGSVDVVDLAANAVQATVKAFPPHPSMPVRTTLDLPMQQAAEAALAGVSQPSAMVVVDTATGEIRAVVNRPVAGLPAAFRSEAPGSTFKVVVAAAALQHGYTPATTVECPATVVFGGKAFKNDEPLPARMSLATAFAVSCNTAFLKVADTLPKGTLRTTSLQFGFGRGNL
ncbi:MAG: penicillin-binding protein transpeptidase, partial [Frankiales bacterium]|nr:penicillin-binding protein transpeptidase [Frankiales bacterium]